MTKVKNVGALILYVFIIVLSAVTVTDVGGFFRTLPIVFIFPALSTFLYNKRLFTVILTFVASFFVSAAMSGDIKNSLAVSFIAALFAFAGIFVKRLFVTSFVCDGKGKRIFCLISASIIIILSFGIYSVIFGNPVSMIVARSENMTYITENYGENDITVGKTNYSFNGKRYFTNISFTDEAVMNADISVKNNIIIDGYHNYYEYKYMSDRAQELSSVLSVFREDMGIGCNLADSDIINAPNILPSEAFDKMVFDIYFGSQIADEKHFADKCKAYRDAVNAAGFVHGALKFYGGFAGEFCYEMTAESGFTGDLSEKILPFNENHLVKRQTEADYMEYWGYGR